MVELVLGVLVSIGSVLLLIIKWNILKSLSRKWVLGLVLPSISIFILFFFLGGFISVSCHYYFILLTNFLIWGTLCSKLLSKCEYVIARGLASLGVLDHVRILLSVMLVFVVFFIRCYYGNVYAMVNEDDPILGAMISGSAESVSSSTASVTPGGAASGSNTPEVSLSFVSASSDDDSSESSFSGDDTIVAFSSSVDDGVAHSNSGEVVQGSKSSTNLVDNLVKGDTIVAFSSSVDGVPTTSDSGEVVKGSKSSTNLVRDSFYKDTIVKLVKGSKSSGMFSSSVDGVPTTSDSGEVVKGSKSSTNLVGDSFNKDTIVKLVKGFKSSTNLVGNSFKSDTIVLSSSSVDGVPTTSDSGEVVKGSKSFMNLFGNLFKKPATTTPSSSVDDGVPDSDSSQDSDAGVVTHISSIVWNAGVVLYHVFFP